jgi:hypothetical protein
MNPQESETDKEQSEEAEIRLSDAGKLMENMIFQGQYTVIGDIGLEMNIPYFEAKRFRRKGVMKFDIPSDDEHLNEFDRLEIRKSDGFDINRKSDKAVIYVNQKEADKLHNFRTTGIPAICHDSGFPVSIILLEPANQQQVTYKYTIIEE